MSDADIRGRIASDPDAAPELSKDWFARAHVVNPRITKVPISLRVDPDVLDWFKGNSDKYQSLMNAVLRAYVQHRQRKS